ncbi:MAG: fumarylacetoacetase [Fimbriimonadaceae bacterium]|nr:fumarylacetoacetase [Chitinophagales bacterium]
MEIIDTNDPSLKSWIPVAQGSDFPIQNLPFGIFKLEDEHPRAGVAIGDFILDLYECQKEDFFGALLIDDSVFENYFLNDLIKLGKYKTRALRFAVSLLLREENQTLQNRKDVYKKFLHPQSEVEMLMPINPGDYTDFYSSIAHATNVGKMFRPDNPLLPNWKHLPVGYHGRCSSIVVSGTEIRRPKGQIVLKDQTDPVYSETKELDFELEMAFITHEGKMQGLHITTEEADDFIFGMVIFNDWSARDIQRWEYVPLGPFLSKSFASSISPWVVTLDALEPFRCEGEKQIPEVLNYLKFTGKKNIDINLEVLIQPEFAETTVVSKSNYKYLYWNMAQQLAHQTINGCNIRSADIYASGTISGEDRTSFGSMLELTWRGTNPIIMSSGNERKFIDDYDTVIMKAWSEKDGVRIGFGEVSGKILPALKD